MKTWKNYNRIFLIIIFNIIISLSLCYLLLFGYNYYLQKKISNQEVILLPYDGWNKREHIDRLYCFPFTGMHSNPNFCGITGPLGFFFVDFNILNPPPKKKNEIRIILIGGSGAQGQNETIHENMLYKQIEKHLNEKYATPQMFFRVINMAMGGSITYQNFIALNQWGHRVEPDLILTYSGFNDWAVPLVYERIPYSYYGFSTLNALAFSTYSDELTPGLKWLQKLFPNLFRYTDYSRKLNALFGDSKYFMNKSKMHYLTSLGIGINDINDLFNNHVVPFYIHALKSIKRDFNGIPIMIAWQCISKDNIHKYGDFSEIFYNDMYERAKKETNGYVNKYWHYINVHDIFYDRNEPDFEIHLSRNGQAIVGILLADEIAKILPMIVQRKKNINHIKQYRSDG